MPTAWNRAFSWRCLLGVKVENFKVSDRDWVAWVGEGFTLVVSMMRCGAFSWLQRDAKLSTVSLFPSFVLKVKSTNVRRYTMTSGLTQI